MLYNYVTYLHTSCSYSYIRENFTIYSPNYHHLFKITFFPLFLPTYILHKWLLPQLWCPKKCLQTICWYLAFRGPWLGSDFRVLLWHLTLIPTSGVSYDLDILDWAFYAEWLGMRGSPVNSLPVLALRPQAPNGKPASLALSTTSWIFFSSLLRSLWDLMEDFQAWTPSPIGPRRALST